MDVRSKRFQVSLKQVAVAAVAVAAVVCAVWGVGAYRRACDHRRWVEEMERLGVRVVIAGYEDTSRGVGRVPVLGELLSRRRQVEVFFDDPETIDAVLAKTAANPEVQRIWIDLTVFDESLRDRIERELPGMDVVSYSPGAGFTTPEPVVQ